MYKAHLTRGGLPQLVAIKTVKGKRQYTLQVSVSYFVSFNSPVSRPRQLQCFFYKLCVLLWYCLALLSNLTLWWYCLALLSNLTLWWYCLALLSNLMLWWYCLALLSNLPLCGIAMPCLSNVQIVSIIMVSLITNHSHQL